MTSSNEIYKIALPEMNSWLHSWMILLKHLHLLLQCLLMILIYICLHPILEHCKETRWNSKYWLLD